MSNEEINPLNPSPQNVETPDLDEPCYQDDADDKEGYDEASTKPTPLPKPPIVLTDEQSHGVDIITKWMALQNEPHESSWQEFKLGGYAGTGKTTIIRTIIERLRDRYCIRVMAFTGKAVNVLQRKGINAQTIHSAIYSCERTPKGLLIWHKRTRLDPSPDLIIVDESSMISTDLYRDLLSYGHKILWVGDPGQLEPVGDNPNLMASADFVLSKIHRQASESPIISLASEIRQGRPFPPYGETFSPDGQSSLVIQAKSVMDTKLVDQILCAKNFTRRKVNETLRIKLGLVPRSVVQGEKIIVLKNNRDFGIFNGMILFVDTIEPKGDLYWEADCHDETGAKFSGLPLWRLPYESAKEIDRNALIPRTRIDGQNVQIVWTDYAYAITCHKSQGSEWDRVLVLDEWMPPQVWEMKRWRYTAITRAAKRLIYAL